MSFIILPTGYPNWPEIVETLESLIANPSWHNLKSSIVTLGNQRKKINHRWQQPEEEDESLPQLVSIFVTELCMNRTTSVPKSVLRYSKDNV